MEEGWLVRRRLNNHHCVRVYSQCVKENWRCRNTHQINSMMYIYATLNSNGWMKASQQKRGCWCKMFLPTHLDVVISSEWGDDRRLAMPSCTANIWEEASDLKAGWSFNRTASMGTSIRHIYCNLSSSKDHRYLSGRFHRHLLSTTTTTSFSDEWGWYLVALCVWLATHNTL